MKLSKEIFDEVLRKKMLSLLHQDQKNMPLPSLIAQHKNLVSFLTLLLKPSLYFFFPWRRIHVKPYKFIVGCVNGDGYGLS
jgi:hypothetical protein